MAAHTFSRWLGVPWLALFAGLWLTQPCAANLPALSQVKERKFLFLGDSNTYAGWYIAYVEGYLRTRLPEQEWNLINLGLPSETVSGLSEPDHPYPRPDIHERVDRALAKIKPDVVFVCYGMNDGIYYPFSEQRLAKYKQGIESLVAKIEKAGAKAILMTPSPFDGIPIAKNLLPDTAAKFSWMKPYRNYDQDVLRKYADYLLTWRHKDYIVIDAHAAVHRFLKATREKDPTYTVSSDGIHPNTTGHAVIALEILRELKAPVEADRVEIDFKTGKGSKNVKIMDDRKTEKDLITFSMTKPPKWSSDGWEKTLSTLKEYKERFNQGTTFKVVGLPAGIYELQQIPKGLLGAASSQKLAKGVDFKLHGDPADLGETLGKRLHERLQILGQAWLTEIGYKRPGTPKGLPLAEAQAKAEKIWRDNIQSLLRPRSLIFTIRKKE